MAITLLKELIPTVFTKLDIVQMRHLLLSSCETLPLCVYVEFFALHFAITPMKCC